MEKHPLLDDAIKRNEDELVNTPPGTPQYQLYRNRVDRHRHESIMAMLEDISKPKKIEKAVLIVGIISVILVSTGLYFQIRQFYWPSQHNPPQSDTIHKEQNTKESGQKTPQIKSNNAKGFRGSSVVPPKAKIDTK